MVFKMNFCFMQVKSIAECSKGSILQYFRPSLSYHLCLRPLFCLFLSGRFTQVLLYKYNHLGRLVRILSLSHTPKSLLWKRADISRGASSFKFCLWVFIYIQTMCMQAARHWWACALTWAFVAWQLDKYQTLICLLNIDGEKMIRHLKAKEKNLNKCLFCLTIEFFRCSIKMH